MCMAKSAPHENPAPTLNVPFFWPVQLAADMVKQGLELAARNAHEQAMATARLVGTPKHSIRARIVPGGHIGLFMGARTLKEAWPEIAAWIAGQDAHPRRAGRG